MKIEKVQGTVFQPYLLKIYVEKAEQEDALRSLAWRKGDVVCRLVDLPPAEFSYICDFLENLKGVV